MTSLREPMQFNGVAIHAAVADCPDNRLKCFGGGAMQIPLSSRAGAIYRRGDPCLAHEGQVVRSVSPGTIPLSPIPEETPTDPPVKQRRRCEWSSYGLLRRKLLAMTKTLVIASQCSLPAWRSMQHIVVLSTF